MLMANPMRNAGRLKEALANSALIITSVLVGYAILEVIFFRLMLPGLPLNYRLYLPDRADFFMQDSKSHYVPQDYIALVGDSYAQGMGDWLLSQGAKSSQPFHSADVIHEILGRDVASLGRAGAGSAEAMVLRVTRIFGDGYCYLFPAIGTPKKFLIYFYEGNDIDDNYKLVQHFVRPTAADLKPQIDAFLDDDYGSVSAWRCHGHLGDTIWKMIQFHIRFGYDPDLTYHVGPIPPINRLLIAGATSNARELDVPSLALDQAQIDTGFLVYERSLAWFRKAFPQIPTTVVYIPSPAAIYRFAEPNVVSNEIYDPSEPQRLGYPQLITGKIFPVPAVYENSQKICRAIRAISLAQGAAFTDTRRPLRSAAAHQALHGPRDWNHLNEAGYRLLGRMLADRIDEKPADVCDDRWE
jgi:hypothetical protein